MTPLCHFDLVALGLRHRRQWRDLNTETKRAIVRYLES